MIGFYSLITCSLYCWLLVMSLIIVDSGVMSFGQISPGKPVDDQVKESHSKERTLTKASSRRYTTIETMCECEKDDAKMVPCKSVADLTELQYDHDDDYYYQQFVNYQYDEEEESSYAENEKPVVPPSVIAARADVKCLCYHDTLSGLQWPCLPMDDWIDTQCTGCETSGNCLYPQTVPGKVGTESSIVVGNSASGPVTGSNPILRSIRTDSVVGTLKPGSLDHGSASRGKKKRRCLCASSVRLCVAVAEKGIQTKVSQPSTTTAGARDAPQTSLMSKTPAKAPFRSTTLLASTPMTAKLQSMKLRTTTTTTKPTTVTLENYYSYYQKISIGNHQKA